MMFSYCSGEGEGAMTDEADEFEMKSRRHVLTVGCHTVLGFLLVGNIKGRTMRDAMARAEWAIETRLAFSPLAQRQAR
jgi:hypothetical protein